PRRCARPCARTRARRARDRRAGARRSAALEPSPRPPGRSARGGRACGLRRSPRHKGRCRPPAAVCGLVSRPGCGSRPWWPWAGAQALAARGFGTPELVAAVEFRRAGMLRRSFFLTREVAGAVTADVHWRTILNERDPGRRRVARRAFARALGELFRRLHGEG